MKSITTLIPDIYQLLKEKEDGWFTAELSRRLSDDLAGRLQSQLSAKKSKPTLRMSGLGKRCPKALWYSIHHPELGEALPPWAEVKFAFGAIIEGLTLRSLKRQDTPSRESKMNFASKELLVIVMVSSMGLLPILSLLVVYPFRNSKPLTTDWWTALGILSSSIVILSQPLAILLSYQRIKGLF